MNQTVQWDWRPANLPNQITEEASLYIVATPIGNLLDISLRALLVLDGVDLVLCEDTRKSHKLFSHYGIRTPRKSYRIFESASDIQFSIEQLQLGKRLAFISDAGTPGISDPCSGLVRKVREACPDVGIFAIPGASALTAALSVSGWQSNPCQYFGFLPIKSGKRQKMIDQIDAYNGVCILYESVHRIDKIIEEIKFMNLDRSVMILREITKMYEQSVYIEAGASDDLWQERTTQIRKKGEFIIMLGPKK